MVLWPVSCRPVQRVPDFHFFRFGDHSADELVVNGLFDEETARGDTVLPLIEEDTGHGLSYGSVQVCVVEDN